MTSDNLVRFNLDDNTCVVVKKLANNRYDFELMLPNGNRKTFIWTNELPSDFTDKKGRTDILSNKAVKQFALLNK